LPVPEELPGRVSFSVPPGSPSVIPRLAIAPAEDCPDAGQPWRHATQPEDEASCPAESSGTRPPHGSSPGGFPQRDLSDKKGYLQKIFRDRWHWRHPNHVRRFAIPRSGLDFGL